MTSLLREGVYEKYQTAPLEDVIEIDELYLIAGHKGKPEPVKKKRKARKRHLKGMRIPT